MGFVASSNVLPGRAGGGGWIVPRAGSSTCTGAGDQGRHRKHRIASDKSAGILREREKARHQMRDSEMRMFLEEEEGCGQSSPFGLRCHARAAAPKSGMARARGRFRTGKVGHVQHTAD